MDKLTDEVHHEYQNADTHDVLTKECIKVHIGIFSFLMRTILFKTNYFLWCLLSDMGIYFVINFMILQNELCA